MIVLDSFVSFLRTAATCLRSAVNSAERMSSVLVLVSAVVACVSCGRAGESVYGGKPKYLWIDACANYERFSVRDSVDFYLDKAADAGFNRIVVDVRSLGGGVLFTSRTQPSYDIQRGYPVRDWDYLSYFIDAAHSRSMKISVSTTFFTAGFPSTEVGPAYDDPAFKGRTCIENTPCGMVDVKYQKDKVAAFLNPALPENQEYVLDVVREIASRYDIDGYSLDYCRYPDMYGDFSDFSRSDFEHCTGLTVESWPDDIFSYDADGNIVAGKYYRAWWTYRASVITDFITRAVAAVKTFRPEAEVSYWAPAWIYAIYGNGQNWASARHAIHQDRYVEGWCDENYMTSGFASEIDAFMLGAYFEHVFDFNGCESVEYAVRRANSLIKGDCRLYTSVYALNHRYNCEDAVYVALRDSEGLMVFDICQVIEFDLWNDILRGVLRAEPELKRK